MKSVTDWLAEKNLGVELAKVLTPGPWKHINGGHGGAIRCSKCFAECDESNHDCSYHFHPCLVPDAIDIKDWNMAMETYRRLGPQQVDEYLYEIWQELIQNAASVNYMSYEMWKDEESQPKHYLIAAACAAGRTEE